jgi:hypothetical protein
MGSDSDGPVLARWNPNQTGYYAQSRLSLIDLDSRTVLGIGSASRGDSTFPVSLSASSGSFVLSDGLDRTFHFRASAGGSLVATWVTGSTAGFTTLTARGPAIVANYRHQSYGHVVPGPDGQTLFTALGGRFDADGTAIDRTGPTDTWVRHEPVLPSADPAYYLSIGGVMRNTTSHTFTISVHAASDGSRLCTVHGLDEMSGNLDWYKWSTVPPSIDKRLYFVPAAELMITVPPTNDRLVLRSLKLGPALDHEGGRRLAVTSPKSLSATAGLVLEHQIMAKSTSGGITYAIARGPRGLTVSPDGRLTWMVPDGLSGKVTAMIIVGDRSEAEVFHMIKIWVE